MNDSIRTLWIPLLAFVILLSVVFRDVPFSIRDFIFWGAIICFACLVSLRYDGKKYKQTTLKDENMFEKIKKSYKQELGTFSDALKQTTLSRTKNEDSWRMAGLSKNQPRKKL